MTEPTPTDAEINALAEPYLIRMFSSRIVFNGTMIDFARAALAKWGTPAQKTNQCGEVCERAKLCAICARELEDTTAPVGVEPVAYLWQHSETGRTRVVMPGQVFTDSGRWQLVGPLVLAMRRAHEAEPGIKQGDQHAARLEGKSHESST